MTWFMVEAVGIILAAFFLPYGIKFLAETKIRLRSSGIVLYYLCHKTATPTQPDTIMFTYAWQITDENGQTFEIESRGEFQMQGYSHLIRVLRELGYDHMTLQIGYKHQY